MVPRAAWVVLLRLDAPQRSRVGDLVMQDNTSVNLPKRLKVYLAAMFSRRDEMRAVAEVLERYGLEVCASWITSDQCETEDHETLARWSQSDVKDVCNCDVFVLFAEEEGTFGAARGGRHVEFGGALFLGKFCYVVGRPENIFHHHPLVTVLPGLEALVDELRRLVSRRGETA